ncbi:MAG: hypothetical protein M1401_15565 [Chloroflexi bacterium]|nr:hypothetical protein [Chloroflexota bacterium]MCL5110246.1 hypothetical protein [Chloroflexota bacterium]
MKCFLALLALALFLLTVWTYRSRVRRAFKAATFGYLALIVINLFRFADDERSLLNVALLIGGSAALWGAGWLVVSVVAKRREAERNRVQPPGGWGGPGGFNP